MSTIQTMSQLADAFEEQVNELHDDIVICGMTFLAGRVLREVDPIAFRCGYLEYADAEGIDTDDLTDDLD